MPWGGLRCAIDQSSARVLLLPECVFEVLAGREALDELEALKEAIASLETGADDLLLVAEQDGVWRREQLVGIAWLGCALL